MIQDITTGKIRYRAGKRNTLVLQVEVNRNVTDENDVYDIHGFTFKKCRDATIEDLQELLTREGVGK